MAVSKRSSRADKQQPVTRETLVMSKLVANLAGFFALADELELVIGRPVDVTALMAEISEELPGRMSASPAETQRILRAVRAVAA
jgi:hypothetical protein